MPHPNAMYVPLSVKEQDVVNRMLEKDDLYVEVADWGYHPKPKITAGDKRIQVRFPMEFTKPEAISVPVYYFTLRLKMRNGKTVAESTESVVHNRQPLYVTAGLQIDLVWDIALDSIDEGLQNQIIPGIKGKKVAEIKGDKVVKSSEDS